MYDLIIIGGGPAGLTATIYALRKRLNVLLVARELGGKTNWQLQLPDIAHHLVINGEELVNQFVNEVSYLDFARANDMVTRIERAAEGYQVHLAGGRTHIARALIVATGATPKTMNVPGEKDFIMRGLCYSAVSYASLFVDRVTAVVGSAELAWLAAAELARIAKHVTLISPLRGGLDSPLGQRLQATDNVLILEGYSVERVIGNHYAQGLVVSKNGDTREIMADGLFVELGLTPNSEVVTGLVVRDGQGRIKIDTRNRTSAPGIFAAGDVTDAYAEQVLISIGEGAKAALSAYEYLLSLPMEESVAATEWR